MTFVYDSIVILIILAHVSFCFWYLTSHCRDDTMETLTVENPPEVTAVMRVG